MTRTRLFSTYGDSQFATDSSFSAGMASADAARAKSAARNVQREVVALRASLAKSMMITEALWELLSEKTGLTQDDLYKKLYDIDMRDGELDGKNQRKRGACPNCGRTTSPRHPACIYCGQVLDKSVFTVDH